MNNMTRDVKGLQTENYKALMKKIKDEKNKYKHIFYSWFGKINNVKLPYYTK